MYLWVGWTLPLPQLLKEMKEKDWSFGSPRGSAPVGPGNTGSILQRAHYKWGTSCSSIVSPPPLCSERSPLAGPHCSSAQKVAKVLRSYFSYQKKKNNHAPLPLSEEETDLSQPCSCLGTQQPLVIKELNNKFILTLEENMLFELLLSRVNKH